ncbi:hypothetical protein [Streptomyces sp. NPDC050485]|uniref:hypothetical protein n=1 Tax=Streptomyces sp. NPDC050485 TaxID=3365617 RepID=UPI0037B1CC0F
MREVVHPEGLLHKDHLDDGGVGLLAKACAAVAGKYGHRAFALLLLTLYPYLVCVFSAAMLFALQIGLQPSRAAILVPAQVVVGNSMC